MQTRAQLRYDGSPYGTTAASPSKPPRRSTNTKRPLCFTCAKLTPGRANVAMPPQAHLSDESGGGIHGHLH